MILLINWKKWEEIKMKKKCFKFVWNRKQDRISRKTVIKSIKKGGMGLLYIQFINGLKLIWIRTFLNDNHKWRNIISVMFSIVRTLDVHGPCLPLKNSKLNLFWRHTLQAYKSFCCKVSPAKADELVTEPFSFIMTTFKLEITQYYTEDGLKMASVASLIFYMNMEISCALRSLVRNTF